MGNQKSTSKFLNQRGQSTVEYILLLAVIVSIMSTVFNSQTFQRFFGEDSAFFNAIAEKMRLDYRYSTNVQSGDDIGNSKAQNHPSFSLPDGSASRFFGYKEGASYPP